MGIECRPVLQHHMGWKWVLLAILSFTVALAQPNQQSVKCQLSIQGNGDGLGISQARLSCQGGTITAAAAPLLLPHVQGATGVQWGNASVCGSTCLLSVCGSSQHVHFEPVVVTKLHALWANAVLCFNGRVTAVVSRAKFLNNQAGFIGVADAEVTLLNSTSRQNLGTTNSHIAGVGAIRQSKVAISGCTFINNTHNSTGGSVVRAADNTTLSITDSTFLHNSALCLAGGRCNGGAIAVAGAAKGKVACQAG